ncbi:MAG: T9SS type A sorting domain-containing protein [Bacteroidota bacterium]
MKKLFTLIAFSFSAIVVFAQNHPMVIHTNGRVASLQMTQTEFNHWNDSDDYNNPNIRTPLVQDIYRKFKDDFDFIFLVYNNATRPTNLTYAGQLIGVSNAITGTGAGIYSQASTYGSAGKLKSLMSLTQNTDMLFGPSLHELMHNWGNFTLNTSCFDPFGPGSGTFNFQPHWGISGCGGQLGGFDQSTLQTNVGGNPNQYSAGVNGHAGFGQFANGGNSLPFSNYELYLMGLIPKDSITTFDVFRDITASNSTAGTFTAATRITYDKTKVVTEFGERTPTPLTSPKSFRVLVLVLTPAALTPTEWTMYDEQVEKFSRPASEGTTLYNFWEATGGRATLDMGNLQGSVGIEETAEQSLTDITLYPNPVTDKVTLTFESKGKMDVTCELTDNMGRVINTQQIAVSNGLNTITPELPALSTGVYFMRLHNESTSVVKRVVVSNE